MAVLEETRLGLHRRGTHFLDPVVEEQYRAWRIEAAVPFNRAGLYIALLSSVTGTASGLLTGLKIPWGSLAMVVPGLFLAIAALRTTYRPHLRRWMTLLTTLTIAFGGLATVAVVNWHHVHSPHLVSFQSIFGWVLLMTFAGLAIVRLPPLHATCAVAPFVSLAAVLYAVQVRAGHAPPQQIADLVLFMLTFIAGLAINVLTDVTSRRLFRQERIIEAQREIIAEEHAKNEALLKQELGHQVAQRSRELGELLARGDGTAGDMDLSVGARFDGRYRIIRALGQGGMGSVFEVERITDRQALALKVVTSGVTRAHALRFTREAEIGARLRHRNLVPIVDVGVAPNGSPFLVMELVKGATLDEHRERFGKAKWAIPVLRQIAEGLAALHDAGVVHRDLKPANVLLTGDVEAPLARISDFGISRFDTNNEAVDPTAETAVMRAQAALTGTGMMLGTPLYMAPEMGRGRPADKAVDIFALGIVAYEMLTGRPPFAMPPVILAMAGQPLPAPSGLEGVPASLGDLVMSCLEAEPVSRPPIAKVLASLAR